MFATPFGGKFIRAIENYIGFEISKIEAPTREEVSRNQSAFKITTQI